MERRLREEEVVTIEVLHERGMSNRGIARQLGVTEHAVRYRLRRRSEGRPERSGRPRQSSRVRLQCCSCDLLLFLGNKKAFRV